MGRRAHKGMHNLQGIRLTRWHMSPVLSCHAGGGGGGWARCKEQGRKEIILRSNSPWGFYPFQPPDSPKGQVARVSGELPPCMTRGSPLRPLGCLT